MVTIDNSSSRDRSRERHWRRVAWRLSLGAHVSVVAAVFLLHPEALRDARDQPVDLVWQRRLSRDDAPSPAPIVTTSARPAARGLSELLRREIERRQLSSAATQIQDLEGLASRLEAISSPDSVAEISRQIGRVWQATKRSAGTNPAPAADVFDFDYPSSQLVDVHWNDDRGMYLGVLEDRMGRTQEVELDEETGARLARLLELMRRFPLLESIYRDIVQGLLNDLLSA